MSVFEIKKKQASDNQKVKPLFGPAAQLKSKEDTVSNKASVPSFLGGEVTNDSDTKWLVSGASNSKESDFKWLYPGKNSQNVKSITSSDIGDDVDAVWPAGKKLKNYNSGNVHTSGAYKLKSHRNTNIDGSVAKGYRIWDFTQYFYPSNLPSGWSLPSKFKK
ncbi:MAG: hypothetical protein ACJAUD_001799 [Crocinitomicaceae bacterium]|jgi:hypothetical protein